MLLRIHLNSRPSPYPRPSSPAVQLALPIQRLQQLASGACGALRAPRRIVTMEHFPQFAERAKAAFGALGSSDWQVADSARFVAGAASGSDEESVSDDEEAPPCGYDSCDEVGDRRVCRALDKEPEEAAEDVVARAIPSPPQHTVASDDEPEEQVEPTRATRITVYARDAPLIVGGGGAGTTEAAENTDAWRAAAGVLRSRAESEATHAADVETPREPVTYRRACSHA